MLGLLDRLQVLVGLYLLISFWEKLKLDSVGLRKPIFIDLMQGILIYMAISILNSLRIYWVLTHDQRLLAQRLHFLATIPLAIRIPSAALNGITEELAARGYAIERLTTLSGNSVFAAARLLQP
jgi:hypothetical protein